MKIWYLSPKYLNKNLISNLWRDCLSAQTILLKGKEIICPICFGSGKIMTVSSHSEACNRCKGKKRIETELYKDKELDRFKIKDGLRYLATYIGYIVFYSKKNRIYTYDSQKILLSPYDIKLVKKLKVNRNILEEEFNSLQNLLKQSDDKKWKENAIKYSNEFGYLEAHPIFEEVK